MRDLAIAVLYDVDDEAAAGWPGHALVEGARRLDDPDLAERWHRWFTLACIRTHRRGGGGSVMGERWVSHLERARVAAGVERLLRQRFPTGAPGVALVRLPIPTAGLRRIAEDVAAVVCGPVDPDAAAVNLDVEVLVLVLQELVALVVDRIAADEATAAVLEAALDAGELLADLGRPVTSDVVAGCTR